MKLHLLIDDPAIILKRELLWVPIWGWYAAKAKMIAVDRGARGRAIASMVEGAKRVKAEVDLSSFFLREPARRSGVTFPTGLVWPFSTRS